MSFLFHRWFPQNDWNIFKPLQPCRILGVLTACDLPICTRFIGWWETQYGRNKLYLTNVPSDSCNLFNPGSQIGRVEVHANITLILYIYISIYMIIRDDSYSNFAASKHCQTKNPASPVENWDWCLYNTDSTWRIFTPGLSELGAKRHVKYIVIYSIPWYWWIIVVRSSSMYVQCVFIFVFPLWLLDAIGSYMFIINPHETSYSC